MNIVSDHKLAIIFRALSHPTRLKLLRLLSCGERCVCKLFQPLGLPQPKVSQHLAYLRKVGLVKARKEGLWQHYSLNDPLIRGNSLDKVIGLGKKKSKSKSNIC